MRKLPGASCLSAAVAIVCVSMIPRPVIAGPPYTTDDPEPVEYRHWEFYAASLLSHQTDSWSGTAPHFEVNYGAAPNLQIHLIAPLAFSAPVRGVFQYGYGDTELGAKYRFIQETAARPQVGTFVMLELPTGNKDRGLGNGSLQAFLPIWLQKTLGRWLTYGGGGYWINTAPGTQNWWFAGWLLQYQVLENLSIGAEVTHSTPQQPEAESETRFNFGSVIDLNNSNHLMFSVGRGLQGPNVFQSYVAYQLTLGPKQE